jgi:hypothetical protein
MELFLDANSISHGKEIRPQPVDRCWMFNWKEGNAELNYPRYCLYCSSPCLPRWSLPIVSRYPSWHPLTRPRGILYCTNLPFVQTGNFLAVFDTSRWMAAREVFFPMVLLNYQMHAPDRSSDIAALLLKKLRPITRYGRCAFRVPDRL